MIAASAAFLYPQLQFKTKQTNTVFMEEDDLNLFQTVFATPDGHWHQNRSWGLLLHEVAGAGGVNGLKGL